MNDWEAVGVVEQKNDEPCLDSTILTLAGCLYQEVAKNSKARQGPQKQSDKLRHAE